MQATDRNSRHQRFIGLVVFWRSRARQADHLSTYEVYAWMTIRLGKNFTTRESTTHSRICIVQASNGQILWFASAEACK